MNFVAGAVLAHSYRLLEPIAEGGMGCVWVADHIALDRKVAVKVITREAVSDPYARERFEREARATAKIDSPHVVRVLDFDFTDDGHPFLVLELLKGETLEERIVRDGPLSLDEATQLLDQATRALSAAHASGILHRDIKAENLFIQRTPRSGIDIKLLDFGIALHKTRTRITMRDVPIGTPQYMSPEQMFAFKEVDERSDYFSLGVCMYYALTGQFPFRGETLAEISVACHRGAFPLPSDLPFGLPIALDAWFERALAHEPQMRFGTAAAMREAFARALAPVDRVERDTPINITVDSEPPPRPEHGRLHKGVRVFVAAAAGACVAIVATRVSALGAESSGGDSTPDTLALSRPPPELSASLVDMDPPAVTHTDSTEAEYKPALTEPAPIQSNAATHSADTHPQAPPHI